MDGQRRFAGASPDALVRIGKNRRDDIGVAGSGVTAFVIGNGERLGVECSAHGADYTPAATWFKGIVKRPASASSGATWSRFDPIEIYFTGPVTGGPGTNWMMVWNRTGVVALKDMYPSGE